MQRVGRSSVVEPAYDFGKLGLAPPGEADLHQEDDDEPRPGNDAGAAAATDGGDGYAGSAGDGLEDDEQIGFQGSKMVIVILRSTGRVDSTG